MVWIYVRYRSNISFYKLTGYSEFTKISDYDEVIEMYCVSTLERSNSNLITSLPDLPNNLYKLDICKSNIITLPSLPNTLTSLTCEHNKLTSFPCLPSDLQTIKCNNRLFTYKNEIKYNRNRKFTRTLIYYI